MGSLTLRSAVGAALAALALAAGERRAAASPQEVVGFGYRSIAMGRTGAAFGGGVDAVYGNPALLSLSHDLELEIGIMGASFDLHALGAGALPSYPSLAASTIGGILPLPFGGVLKDRVTIGLGFVTPFDLVVRGRILYPDKPQFLLADRVQSVAVQAALGLDIGYGVRIGGGFAALAALDGSVVVATDASGRIGTVVEDTLVASYAPIVGASYDISDAYRLGLAFRGELVGRFNVVIEAENLGTIKIPPLNISGLAQYDPWMFQLEIARVKGPWQMALSLSYKHWAAYPGPAEATVRCEDTDPFEPDCGAPTVPDAGYHPIVTPSLGVDRAIELAPVAKLHVRGGYTFEPSPAPEQKGRSSYFDNHRSVFSVGWGIDLEHRWAPLSFDGYVQVQWLHDRDHEKSVSEGATAEATIETRGLVAGAGTAATVRF